jgi:hypothetical protein
MHYLTHLFDVFDFRYMVIGQGVDRVEPRSLQCLHRCISSDVHVSNAMVVKLFTDAAIPDPVPSVVTNWGLDPCSRGAYSYVAVRASGQHYDILGPPVVNCLFFAGEATCKEHPDTVGGVSLNGH